MAVLRWVPLVGLSVFLGCAGAAPSAPRTLAAAAPVPLTAAPSASAPPSSAAPDPQAALAAKVDPVFASFADKRGPGCSVGLYRAGEILYAKGYGYADLEHDAANTDTTVFYLASVSKQFTAAAVLLLVQSGKVSLDDDIRKYVPELPDYGAKITIAQLIHHTSGVRDYGLLLYLAGRPEEDLVTQDDLLWIIAHQRALNFAPGARWSYTNAGYVLLSTLVARVSGEPLSAFLAERVFAPLGMNDTFVKDDHTRIVPRRAVGYSTRRDGTYGVSMSDSEYTGPGNVMTTVRDLAKWDGMFYAPKVGGQALIDAMRAPFTLSDGTPITYESGLERGVAHGLPMEEHDGGFVGYRTIIRRFPTVPLTVAVLCNDAAAKPEDLASRVEAAVLPGLVSLPATPPDAPAPATAPAKPPAASAVLDSAVLGAYIDLDTVEVRVVERTADGLRIGVAVDGSVKREIEARGPHQFVVKGGTTQYTYEPARGALPAHLLRMSDDGPARTFVRFEPVHAVPASQLAAYAGRYTSAESPRDVELAVKDGKLVASPWGSSGVPLESLAADVFVVDGSVGVRFERDAGRRVRGFVVGDDRAIGVRFERR